MNQADLARRLVDEADDLMFRRKILLTASVALAATPTISAAVKALNVITVPEIRDGALRVIEELRT